MSLQVITTINTNVPITEVHWNEAGTRLASVDESGIVKVWDSQGSEISTFSIGRQSFEVAWKPSRDQLAIAKGEAGIEVWNTATGQLVADVSDAWTSTVDWSPDGSYLVYGGYEPGGSGLPTIIPAPSSQQTSLAITSTALINADTDTAIGSINDGDVLVLDDLPANFQFNIDATVSGSPGSVVFDGSWVGASSVTYDQTESSAPYSWFGDTGGSGDYNGEPLREGTYTVTVTSYSESGLGGVAGTPITLSFTVVQ
ncbi:hypothetical protein HC928_17540 [bacterium]|nr:hypothetical protein [bacterium]